MKGRVVMSGNCPRGNSPGLTLSEWDSDFSEGKLSRGICPSGYCPWKLSGHDNIVFSLGNNLLLKFKSV